MALRRQMFAVLSLSLIACTEPTVSDRSVEVTLTVDRTVFHAGDTARVAVAAVNRGARAVTIAISGCAPAFLVLRPDGAVAVPGPQSCALVAVTRELGPGEHYVFRYGWALDANGNPLPPGTYELRGRVLGQYLRAESAPVEIRVEAPAASD